MQTIILYKVVWVDGYGDVNEKDFPDLTSATQFYHQVQNAQVYEYRILGQMKEVTIL
jgi:hypothetical protein